MDTNARFRSQATVMACFTLMISAGLGAEEIRWTNGAGDQSWSNPANWQNGSVPSNVDIAYIKGPLEPNSVPVIQQQAQTTSAWVQDSELRIEGGTLSTGSLVLNPFLLDVVELAGLSIDGGSVTVNVLDAASRNWGIISIFEGKIWCDWLRLTGSTDFASSDLWLWGGTIDAEELRFGTEDSTTSLWELDGGVLRIQGDQVDAIRKWIDTGRIELHIFGGEGESAGKLSLEYIDDVNDISYCKTVVKPIEFFDPVSPAEGSTVPPGDVTLNWSLPPGTTSVDVWLTQDPDEIFEGTATPIVSGPAQTSVTVQVGAGQYYWAVDAYMADDEALYSLIYSFWASTTPPDIDSDPAVNAAPEVNAGPNFDVVLQPGDDPINIPLKGMVQDDGEAPPTVRWEIVMQAKDSDSALAAHIADPHSLNTTLQVAAPGRYILQLTADDGEKNGFDRMRVLVAESP